MSNPMTTTGSAETPSYNPAKDDGKMRVTMTDPGAGGGFPTRWVRCMAAEILELKAARNAGIDAQHELHEQLYQARLALTAAESRLEERLRHRAAMTEPAYEGGQPPLFYRLQRKSAAYDAVFYPAAEWDLVLVPYPPTKEEKP